MSRLPELFGGPDSLQQSYVSGLQEMLQHGGLGTFILVLANAIYDDVIYARLQDQIEERYSGLCKQYRPDMDDAPDDVTVFGRLRDVGLENLMPGQMRELSPWRLQFNQLRSFRPSRMSQSTEMLLSKPFNEDGFHFNKPFLQKEIWWQGELAGQQCRLLYNKFPFVDYHGILVIEPEQLRPQLLDAEAHRFVWDFLEMVGDKLPGSGVGYNALGAAASVNHQHFQYYCREKNTYPIEQETWTHNGGNEAYPVESETFTDVDLAWEAIQSLHSGNMTYNLLYRPGMLYIIQRQFQGQFEFANWLTGLGWSDLCGEAVIPDADEFNRLQAEDFESQLKLAALP